MRPFDVVTSAIISVLVLGFLWDVFAYVSAVRVPTVTQVVHEWCEEFPILVPIAFVIFWHLFWPHKH